MWRTLIKYYYDYRVHKIANKSLFLTEWHPLQGEHWDLHCMEHSLDHIVDRKCSTHLTKRMKPAKDVLSILYLVGYYLFHEMFQMSQWLQPGNQSATARTVETSHIGSNILTLIGIMDGSFFQRTCCMAFAKYSERK